MPPILGKKRYHDLDALRAFAMLLGIALHGFLSFMPNPIWPGQDIDQPHWKVPSEIIQTMEQAGASVPKKYSPYQFALHAIHGFRMPLLPMPHWPVLPPAPGRASGALCTRPLYGIVVGDVTARMPQENSESAPGFACQCRLPQSARPSHLGHGGARAGRPFQIGAGTIHHARRGPRAP